MLNLAFAAALGVLTVFGFAPFHLTALPVVTLALLALLWQAAPTPRRAAWVGGAFGLGFFGGGVHWVFVSMHLFGQVDVAVATLLTVLFCAFLSLYTGAAGYFCKRAGGGGFGLAVAFPVIWTALEWLRGWLLTGFPWLSIGATQASDVVVSPLTGFAPLGGGYAVTWAVALLAGLLAWWLQASGAAAKRAATVGLAAAGLLLGGGALLQRIEWTRPVGQPVSVALLQGNIAQDHKWDEEFLESTLALYLGLVDQSTADLVVLPETALPLFLHQVPPEYWTRLVRSASARGANVLVGIPEVDRERRTYYNSVISLGRDPTQTYRKYHIVPFGEYIPLRFLFNWLLDVLKIPLLDFGAGPQDATPLALSGQRLALNICYEDAFGDEIIRQLPEATILVNVSNDAWFGTSVAPWQHLQIAQMRSLETGRPMLRSNNTGVTAIIDAHGNVVSKLPQFQIGRLTGSLHGYQGVTPYVRGGDGATVALLLAALGAAAWWLRRRRGRGER